MVFVLSILLDHWKRSFLQEFGQIKMIHSSKDRLEVLRRPFLKTLPKQAFYRIYFFLPGMIRSLLKIISVKFAISTFLSRYLNKQPDRY